MISWSTNKSGFSNLVVLIEPLIPALTSAVLHVSTILHCILEHDAHDALIVQLFFCQRCFGSLPQSMTDVQFLLIVVYIYLCKYVQGGVCNVGIGSNEACIEETSPQLEQEEPSKIPAADTNVGRKVMEPCEANSCSSTSSIDGSKDSYDSSAMLGSAIDKQSPTSRVELNGGHEKVTRKGDSQPENEKIVEMVESVQDLSIASTGGVVEDNKS